MNDDLDRLLRESLGAVKKTYERERAPEPQRAESRLLQRLRRKRGWFGAGAALAAGVIALLVAFLAFSLPGLIRSHNSPQVAADNDPAIKLSVATDPQPVTVGIRYGKQWVGTSLGVQIFSERDARFVHRVNLGAPPSDLRLGDTQAWVTLPALGEVASINERTYAIHRYHVVQGRAATMSLSVGDTAVWIVVNGERIVRLDLTTAKLLDVPVSQPLDISARRSSEVWAFTKSGLQRLDTNSGQPVGPLIPNPTSTGDIFIRDDAIYLASADSDQVVKVKGTTRKFRGRFTVRGTYVDMAVASGAIWILSRLNSDTSLLSSVDPISFQSLAPPIRLSGDPVDVTADETSVWVVERATNRLLRIDQTTALSEGPP